MAIYHLEGKIISRSQGRSAVAAAAYRACERLVDERTGLTHDFTRKGADRVQAEILLPASAPREFSDRETLWNAVEVVEKRKDAQLCREFNIALPRELTETQNWLLAKAFVHSEFVERGMIADVAFHRGHKSQAGQPHVHVMLTLRSISAEGFGPKVREWNDRALLMHWREAWADHCNRRFLGLDLDLRIDHRTLEAQGIDLEPQTKIGPSEAKARLARFQEHQEKARTNGEWIIADPEIALKAVVSQQSTFTHHDLARVVNRYTADQVQFQAAYNKVLTHPELVLLGKDDQGRDRYTTRTMLVTERQLVEQAIALSDRERHIVAPAIREEVTARYTLSEDQRAAYDYLLAGGDIRNLVGIAGSGKSYLLGAIKEAHELSGHRVIGMAMAGKAAENLAESSGIESRTVASYIASWANDRDRLTSKDVIVIDEAGMLGSEQYARLLHEAHTRGAKVIPVFDTEQLQAIAAGASARAVAERTGFVELTEVRRQRAAWQREATRDFAMGETQKGLLAYEAHDNVHAFTTQAKAREAMLEHWQAIRSSHPDQTQLMLAYTRVEVNALNEAARVVLKENGGLGQDHSISTERGAREFAVGDRVYFLKNDYQQMDVRNGTLGTIEAINDQHLRVRLDAKTQEPARSVEFNLKDYNALDHGYATTLHKGQGATVDYSHVLADQYFDRHLTYVGMTRHRESANLYWSRETFPDFRQATKTMSRENAKDFTLDYAEIRGLEVKEEYCLKREVIPDRSPDRHDRMAQAEARLQQREFQRSVSPIEKRLGLSLRTDLEAGDTGIYRGLVEINEQRYGVLDMGDGQGKLVPRVLMESTHRDKTMTLERDVTSGGQTVLKARQAYERQRGRERDGYGGRHL